MRKEKKSFSETRFYPVFFMIIVTIVFVGVLAFFYQATIERVENYQTQNYKKSLISLFGYSTEDIEKTYNQNFQKAEKNDLVYYKVISDNVLKGYCFDISGSGLWGTINAIVAVTPDFQKIIGFDILKQNETPGLGGRITEDWFKDQFTNKVLKKQDTIIQYQLIPEDETTKENQIKQITGATFSSKAVVTILYNNVLEIVQKVE